MTGKQLSVAIALIAFGFSGISVSAQETDTAGLPSGVTDAQLRSAFAELGALYGGQITSVAQAREVCNEEKYLADCAAIGKKYGLYQADEAKQVDAVLADLKGKVVEDLKSCTDEACLVAVANRLAQSIAARNPSLARQIELTPAKIKEKQAFVSAANDAGVSFGDCQRMDPDTASVDLLRSCAKLAKDSRIKNYLPAPTQGKVVSIEKMISLKEALTRGEYQCGNNTPDGCGAFCLAPSDTARSAGTSAIPQVCRDIATRFFGPEGLKELEGAYSQVSQITETYSRRARNILFTTADGQTLTDPAAIGRYLEEQGRNGNIGEVERGMEFMIGNGFAKPEEKEFVLKMVRKAQEMGGAVAFDQCRQNPEKCREFIPDEFRKDFEVMREIDSIMRAEMGFDPRECEKGETDRDIGLKCLAGSKRALVKLEALPNKSPEVIRVISDIRFHVERGEEMDKRRDEFSEFFSKGGPGGCRSESECKRYCSDPANGPECIAFGAKNQMSGFKGEEAVERYREFQAPFSAVPAPVSFSTTTPQFPNQPYPFGAPFDGGQPYGSRPFDSAQGKPFVPGQGFQPIGPGPECFAAIESGDFVKAKELCRASGAGTGAQPPPYQYPTNPPRQCVAIAPEPCPEGQYRQQVIDNGCPRFEGCVPIPSYQKPPSPEGRINICPTLPTVESCPPDQERFAAFSSPECGVYYGCRPRATSDRPPYPEIRFPYTFGNGQVANSWEDAKQYCLRNGPGSGSGVAAECETKFGVRYAGAACPSGQYWNGSNCVSSTQPPPPSPSNQRTQAWNSLGLQSQVRSDADAQRIERLKQACANVPGGANIWMPGAGNYENPDFGMPDPDKCQRAAACSSGQYFDGASCVTTSGSGFGGWNPPSTSTATTYPPSGGSGGGGSCPGFAHEMGGYCMLNNDTSRCADYPNAGAESNYTSSVCQLRTAGPGAGPVYSPSTQRTQAWNSLGLQSQVRSDADAQRIERLKQACANVPGGANIWMPGAGNYENPDFGMPDPDKCQRAAACSSGQYFDGASCITSGSGGWTPPSSGGSSYPGDANSCPGFSYSVWDSTGRRYCQLNSTRSCQYEYPAYLTESNYRSESCPASTVTTYPSSGGTGTTCPSDQYWNGSSCVPNPAPSGGYSQDPATACSQGGGSWTGSYCQFPGSSTSTSPVCPQGQYWNGSSCVTAGINAAHFVAQIQTFFWDLIRNVFNR